MTAIKPQTVSLDIALRQAVAHQQAGRLQEAEKIYREILQAQPNKASVNYSLGLLAYQAGRHAEALPYLKAALASNPSREQYVLSYAEALLTCGQAKEALNILRKAMRGGLNSASARALRSKAESATPSGSAQGEEPSQTEVNELVALFNAARHDELEARARTLIERFPGFGFAWKVLGASLQVQGKEALPALQRAAALLPADAEAYSNLGTAQQTIGQFDDAAQSFRRALALAPGFAAAHYNLGNVLRAIGRLDDAVKSFRQALAIEPDYAEAHNNLGFALKQLGRPEDAVTRYRRALEIRPDYCEAHNNLGIAQQKLGRVDDAVASFRRALEITPEFVEAHSNLGSALQALGHLDEAAACCRRALEINPGFVKAHNNLGSALLEQDRLDEAVASFRRALEIDPGFVKAHSNLGSALQAIGRLDEAVASCRRALEIEPDFLEAHDNLGCALQAIGRLDEAVASYRRALEIKPDLAETRFNLALATLAGGRLTEGWTDYEHRYCKVANRNFTHRYWRGEDLKSKSILIWGEQGIGDEMMFASMYGEIIDQAGRCVIECTPKLMPLFVRSFPKAQIVPLRNPPHPATLEDFNYQCAAGSLARWLRPSLESFPSALSYFTPDPDRVAYWKTRLAALGPGLKVGFCWRSSLMTGARPLYYTKLDQWGPVFAVPGIHFVNLQYDECAAELQDAGRRFGIPLHSFDEIDLYNDLDEAAALTRALDLVISAPTAAGALAAALGVPTWFRGYANDWTALGTDHYPWHPSARLIHAPWDRPWAEIMQDIAGQLKGIAAKLA